MEDQMKGRRLLLRLDGIDNFYCHFFLCTYTYSYTHTHTNRRPFRIHNNYESYLFLWQLDRLCGIGLNSSIRAAAFKYETGLKEHNDYGNLWTTRLPQKANTHGIKVL